MYLFQRQGKEYKVIDKEWEHVRDQLVNMRTNGGFPYLVVEDGDYLKNGELYIKHSYEGIELDLKYLEKVLPYLHQLWGRTVHMESIVESKGVVFSYDGKMVHRKYVKEAAGISGFLYGKLMKLVCLYVIILLHSLFI